MGNMMVGGCCIKEDEEEVSNNPIIQVPISNIENDIGIPSTVIEKKEDEKPKELKSEEKEEKNKENPPEENMEQPKEDKKPKTVFDKYDQLSRIGEGYFGTVYKAKEKETGQLYALKEILINSLVNGKKSNRIIKEIEIVKRLDNHGIVKVNDFFEDSANFYIISELCDGNLEEKLKNNLFFCEFLTKYIMYQVLVSIDYLHKNNITHKDIKPSNVGIVSKKSDEKYPSINDLILQIKNNEGMQKELLTVKNICDLNENTKLFLKNLLKYEFKLMDYDVIELFKQKENDEMLCLTGTLNYLSPEIFSGSDIMLRDEWACGILMYSLLTGSTLFEGDSKDDIINNIKIKNLDLNSNEFKQKTKGCKDLITGLLNKDPRKRLKANEALKHEYFSKGIKINELLDPANKDLLNVDTLILNNYQQEQYIEKESEKTEDKNINNIKVEEVEAKKEEPVEEKKEELLEEKKEEPLEEKKEELVEIKKEPVEIKKEDLVEEKKEIQEKARPIQQRHNRGRFKMDDINLDEDIEFEEYKKPAPKKENNKKEEIKMEETKHDEPEKNEVKSNEIKNEEPKQEILIQEEKKQEESKQELVEKVEEQNPEERKETKTEESTNEKALQESEKNEESKKEYLANEETQKNENMEKEEIDNKDKTGEQKEETEKDENQDVEGKNEETTAIKKEQSPIQKAIIEYITSNYISKRGIYKLNDVFNKITEGDENFKIDKKNFVEGFSKAFKDFAEEEIIKLFEEVKDPNIEAIEYKNFKKIFSTREKLLYENLIKKAFEAFDTFSTGKITWDKIFTLVFNGEKEAEFIEYVKGLGYRSRMSKITYEDFSKALKL